MASGPQSIPARAPAATDSAGSAGPVGPGLARFQRTTSPRRNHWVSGPTPNANTTVPTPTVPPSSTPTANAPSSIRVRTRRSGQPLRRVSPVISPSRGPGPSCAPTYSAVAKAQATTPASMNSVRGHSPSGVGSHARWMSAKGPSSSVLATVPRPGICRSGSQARSTATEVTTITVPNDSGTRPATPRWNTSHGAAPSPPSIISAAASP